MYIYRIFIKHFLILGKVNIRMSNHSRTGNPNGEKSAVGGSSGPQHRKRQSPNTIGLTLSFKKAIKYLFSERF